jgi:hypothetical protein
MIRSRSETIPGLRLMQGGATCVHLQIGVAAIKDRFDKTLDGLFPNLLSSINAILFSVIGRIVAPGTRRLGFTSTWSFSGLAEKNRILVLPPAAVYGVPAAALPKIAVPPGGDARELRLQIAQAMEPCVSECHSLQRSHHAAIANIFTDLANVILSHS